MFSRPLFHLALIAALGLIVYSNTFGVPFQFDDKPIIVENPAIKDFSYFIDPSKVDYLAGISEFRRECIQQFFKTRFIGLLSFWANYKVGGLKVEGFHAVNLAIHIINALLVYLIVALTFLTPVLTNSRIREQAKSIALLSGLLFVCHPVQTQAVTYIVQRFASLATTFYLLSLVMYVKYRLRSYPPFPLRGGGTAGSVLLYFAALLCALLAMKTKEIAFTLPLVIALYEFMFFEGGVKRRLFHLGPLFLTILIIPLTLVSLNVSPGDVLESIAEATRVQTGMSRLEYLITQFRVIVTYIRLFFLPAGQSIYYDNMVYHSFLEPPVFLSFLFLLCVLGLGIHLYSRSRITDHASRLCAFGIFWFFLTISVESSVIPIADVIFEHRTYLPSAGAFMAIGSGVVLLTMRFKKAKKAVGWALAAMVLVLSGATYARNTVWQSETSLWEDTVKKAPGRPDGHFYLGMAYDAEGLAEKAIKAYKYSIRLKPDAVYPHINLAAVYLYKGRMEKAIENYKAALKLDPDNAEAHFNLGSVYQSKGMTEDAIEHYKAALKSDPGFTDVYIFLGKAYMEEGFIEKAEEQFRTALRLNPYHAEAYSRIGRAYLEKGDADRAVEHLEAALKLDPDNAEAHNNLGAAYQARGQVDRAIEQYRLAAELEPRSPTSYYNLGGAYYSKGLIDNAIQLYLIALKLNPDYPEAHGNLGLAYQSKGMADKAIEHYRAALELDPDYAQAHFNLGLVFFQKGYEDKAREEFEAALQIDPGYQRARQFLSKLDQKR